MKRETQILGLGLIFFTQTALADHTTQQRSSCSVLPKYKAVAKLKKTSDTFWHDQTDTGCGFATAVLQSDQFEAGTCPDMPLSKCGESYCHIGNDGFDAHGQGTEHDWEWGSNNTLVLPQFSYAPIINKINLPYASGLNFVREGYKGDAIVFDSKTRTITIKNLNAYLKVGSRDLNNSFCTIQFKVFVEKIIEGESVPQKTIWFAKATVIGGELLLEGDFTREEFTDNSSKDMKSFSIDNRDKVITVADGIDFESLVIDLSGDSGNLSFGINETYAPNLNSDQGKKIIEKIKGSVDFNFTVFHNQDAQKIEVDVIKNTNDAAIEKASILSIDGRLIKTYSVNGGKELHQEYSTGELRSGAYFFSYSVNGQYYFKKFIK